MKKLFIIIIALAVLFTTYTSQEANARGIGIKGGYATMRGDFSDCDDQWVFGIYFDVGKFIFNSLYFKVLVDKTTIEGDDAIPEWDVWSLHLDWYWYFMNKRAIAPFIGFGPSFNYLVDDDDDDDNDDSDAGVDIFGGCDFDIAGPLTLTVEVRYRFEDIAQRNANILQGSIGIQYNF